MRRLKLLSGHAGLGGIYLNLVGSQDSLIFDGGSLVVDKSGKTLWEGAFFEPDFTVLSFSKTYQKSSSHVSKSNLKKENN